MAVLAASGASFAQVAITGQVAMGYAATKDAAGNEASGLGVDTATLAFGVTEDLGGGMKIVASQSFDTVAREGVIGGDTKMALSTSAYTMTLGSTLLLNYLDGGNANVGGLPLNLWTNRIFNARGTGTATATDWAQITVPFGPVTVGFTHYENGTAANLGLGVGSAGSSAQRLNLLTVGYAAGPLKADAGFGSYDNQGTTASNSKSRARAAVSYDLGMAQVGGGIDAYTLNVGTRTDAMLSVGIPVGPVQLGANIVTRTLNGTANDSTYNGYSVSAGYALSKSTSVQAQFQNWQNSAPVNGSAFAGGVYAGTASTKTEIALVKNF